MSPENTKALATLDQNYPIQKYNRLFQSQNIMNATLAPYQRMSYEVVQVDISKGSSAIFKTGSTNIDGKWVDLFSLAKPTLDQLGMALSIEWNPEKTKRIDTLMNQRLVIFQAVGKIIKPDGTELIITGTKEVDLDAIEAVTRFKLEETAREGKLKPYGRNATPYQEGTPQCDEEIERRVKAKMVQVAIHKTALAESGAKNRAIRSTGLKSAYTLAELAKPFVVSRVDFDASQITDPSLKRMIAERAMGAQNDMYPQEHVQHHEPVEYEDPEQEDDLKPENEIQPEEPTPEEVARNDYMISIEGMSNEDRFVQMESLAKRKKVVGADGTSQWLPGKNWTSKPEQEQVNEIMAVYDRDEPLPAN